MDIIFHTALKLAMGFIKCWRKELSNNIVATSKDRLLNSAKVVISQSTRTKLFLPENYKIGNTGWNLQKLV